MGKMFKRMLLSVLSLVLTVGMVQYRPVHALDVKTITHAEVVANNHDINSKEKDVLTSGGLNTGVFTYEVPTDSSLVKVDAKAYTIKAKSTTDNQGNVWVPVEAYVSGNDTPYTLVNGECTFTPTGDKYSVTVTYKAYVTISAAEQVRFLNTAYYLYDAKVSLDTLLGTESNLDFIAPLISDMYDDLVLRSKEANSKISSELLEAFKALNDQVKDDDKFELSDLINNYYTNYNKYVEYFYSEDLKILKEEAKQLAAYFNVLLDNEDYLTFTTSQFRQIENLVADLEEGSDEQYWSSLYFNGTEKLVNLSANLTKLNSIVAARNFKNLDTYKVNENATKLELASTSIKASVAMHDVTVNIKGIAYDQYGAEVSLTDTTKIRVDDGSTVNQIFDLLSNQLKDTKTKWNAQLATYAKNYVIDDTTYSMSKKETVSNGEITQLTITYSPKKVDFVVEGVSSEKVNYGSFITFASKANKGSYEYRIGNKGYTQGQTYRVLQNTTASRVEMDVVKETKSIFKLIAQDSFYGLNDKTISILTSKALVSPQTSYVALSEQNPAKVTLVANKNGCVLTAPSYKAYVEDMTWVPVKYSINGGAPVAMNGNTVSLTGDVNDAVVYYSLKVTKNASTGDNIIDVNGKLTEWVNLPYVLIQETKGQVEVLDKLASMADPDAPNGYLTMGGIIHSALNILLDENVTATEEAAIKAILNNCFVPGEKTLKILGYVQQYQKEGLIAYYKNSSGYDEQLTILSENLEIVLKSDAFNAIKDDPAYAAFKDQLYKVDSVQSILSDARSKLVKPNEYINLEKDSKTQELVYADDIASLLAILLQTELEDVNYVNDTSNGLHDYYQIKVNKEEAFSFTDVGKGKWYYSIVKEAFAAGLMSGTSETTFSPDENMTRGMIVTVLHRIAGKPNVAYTGRFPDVGSKSYCATAVEWAAKNRVVSGYSNGKFGPNDNITRQDVAVILYNYARSLGLDVTNDTDLSKFKDYKNVSAYAKPAMEWAVSVGILGGATDKDTGDIYLNPKNNATRAECAKMLLVASKIYKK